MILVTGATGTVGRPLVNSLVNQGARVRVVTRDPYSAGFPVGVDIVTGDPSQPETLAEHLDGVQSVFLNSTAVRDATVELAGLAKRRGVQRLVALAAYNVDQDLSMQPSRFVGDRNRECEAAAENSGLEWVSLRPHVFSSSTIPLWGGQVRTGDTVAWPYPEFAETVVDPRDVAEVGAHALLSDDLLGRKPILTGPAAITHFDMVATIAQVLDRRLRYREISPLAFVDRIAETGLPPAMAASFLPRYVAFEGEEPDMTDEIQRILGRQARTYRDWVTDHAAAFVG